MNLFLSWTEYKVKTWFKNGVKQKLHFINFKIEHLPLQTLTKKPHPNDVLIKRKTFVSHPLDLGLGSWKKVLDCVWLRSPQIF